MEIQFTFRQKQRDRLPVNCFVIFFVAAVIMVSLSGCSNREFEGVHESDRLLSHPNDPNRMAEGVTMDKIVPRVALPKVKEAIDKHPGTPRFYYQLGRAHQAAGDHEEAISAYLEAAKRNYPMAHYNLGIAYGEGKIVAQDLEKAINHLQFAAESNIAIAQDNLKAYVFESSGFSSPDLMQAIYDKKLTKGDIADSELRGYAFSFLEPFFNTEDIRPPISRTVYFKLAQGAKVEALGQIFGDLAASRRDNPSRGIGDSFSKGFQEGQAMSQKLVAKAERGRADAELFFERYGVETPVARQFFDNLEFYIQHLGKASFVGELERSFGR